MPEQRHSTTIDIKVDDRQIIELGREIEQTFSTRTIEVFNAVLERQTKSLDTLIKQQTELQRRMDDGRRRAKDDEQKQRQPPSAGMMGFATGAGAFAGTYLGQRAMMAPGMIGQAAGGRITESLLGLLPGGAAVTGVVGGAQQFYQGYVQQQSMRAAAFGRTGLAPGQFGGLEGVGGGLGIMPEMMPQLLQQLADQTGLTGEALGAVAPALLQLQRFAGVQGGGALISAAGAAGGQVSPDRAQGLLIDAVGSGLMAGIRESRLDNFIQSISSWTEEMRDRGMPIDPESVLGMARAFGTERALGGAGLQGMQAARTTLGMAGALQQAPQGRSFLSGIIMRAAGHTGEPGGVSYPGALKKLQGPERMSLIPSILEGFREMLGTQDVETLGLALSLGLRELGQEMMQQQAEDIITADPEKLKRLMGLEGAKQADVRAKRFMEERAGRAHPMLQPLQAEARFRRQEIEVGGRPEVTRLVQQVRATDIQAVKEILPIAADLVSGIIDFGKEILQKAGELLPARKTVETMRRALDVGGIRAAAEASGMTADEAAAYEANIDLFTSEGMEKFEAAVQASMIQSRRRQEAAAGGAKAGAVAGAPTAAEAPAMAAGGGGVPLFTSSASAAAFHLKTAAGFLEKMSDEDVDMVFSESEATVISY